MNKNNISKLLSTEQNIISAHNLILNYEKLAPEIESDSDLNSMYSETYQSVLFLVQDYFHLDKIDSLFDYIKNIFR